MFAVSETGLRWLSVGDDAVSLEAGLRTRFPKAMLVRDPDALAGIAAWFDGFWQEGTQPAGPTLDPVGTEFQRTVWTELRRIPRGARISYGELARRIGSPKAVRAVAQACGANPLLLVIPCHRVVGANGALTGFAAGIERKKALLERENPPLV